MRIHHHIYRAYFQLHAWVLARAPHVPRLATERAVGVPIASLRGLGSDFRAVAPNNVGATKLIIQAPQQLELPSVINVQVEYRLSRPGTTPAGWGNQPQ